MIQTRITSREERALLPTTCVTVALQCDVAANLPMSLTMCCDMYYLYIYTGILVFSDLAKQRQRWINKFKGVIVKNGHA